MNFKRFGNTELCPKSRSVYLFLFQTDLWLDSCQGDKHVSIIITFFFCYIHSLKAGGFKNTKKLLTLNQIAIYIQTPAIVFLVQTHIRPLQQLTEHTDIVFSSFSQMICRTNIVLLDVDLIFDTCAASVCVSMCVCVTYLLLQPVN